MFVYIGIVHHYTVWCYVFVLDEFWKARVSWGDAMDTSWRFWLSAGCFQRQFTQSR